MENSEMIRLISPDDFEPRTVLVTHSGNDSYLLPPPMYDKYEDLEAAGYSKFSTSKDLDLPFLEKRTVYDHWTENELDLAKELRKAFRTIIEAANYKASRRWLSPYWVITENNPYDSKGYNLARESPIDGLKSATFSRKQIWYENGPHKMQKLGDLNDAFYFVRLHLISLEKNRFHEDISYSMISLLGSENTSASIVSNVYEANLRLMLALRPLICSKPQENLLPAGDFRSRLIHAHNVLSEYLYHVQVHLLTVKPEKHWISEQNELRNYDINVSMLSPKQDPNAPADPLHHVLVKATFTYIGSWIVVLNMKDILIKYAHDDPQMIRTQIYKAIKDGRLPSLAPIDTILRESNKPIVIGRKKKTSAKPSQLDPCPVGYTLTDRPLEEFTALREDWVDEPEGPGEDLVDK